MPKAPPKVDPAKEAAKAAAKVEKQEALGWWQRLELLGRKGARAQPGRGRGDAQPRETKTMMTSEPATYSSRSALISPSR